MKKKALSSRFSWMNPEAEPWYVVLAYFGMGILALAVGLGLIVAIVKMWGLISH